jgi:hypothetical protein
VIWARFIPAAILAALLGIGVWWVQGLRLENQRLEAENATLSRSIVALKAAAEQSAVARAAEAARANEWQARAGQLAGQIETILMGDFSDALLDPGLADLINRLRQPAD